MILWPNKQVIMTPIAASHWMLCGQVANGKIIERKFATLIIRAESSHEPSILVHSSENRFSSRVPCVGHFFHDAGCDADLERRGGE